MVSGQAFPQCTACSKQVIDAFEAGGFSFLRQCFDEVGFLERTTGLDKLSADVDDIDFDMSDDDEGAL